MYGINKSISESYVELGGGGINNPDTERERERERRGREREREERERERERRERERPTNQRVTMVSILDGSLNYRTLHM